MSAEKHAVSTEYDKWKKEMNNDSNFTWITEVTYYFKTWLHLTALD